MSEKSTARPPRLPPIVHIVLAQVARMRSEGALSDAEAESKVSRLIKEELDPRGFKLLRRELPGGRLRFLIKAAATGAVCDMIESHPGGVSHAA